MHVGGNKNANNCQIGADGKRDWSYDLFDCFSRCGLCKYENRPPIRTIEPLLYTDQPLPTTGCEAHYCICIVRSKTRQRMHHLQVHGTPLPPGGSVPGVGILTIVDAVRMRY
jgi:hypothetical protein